MASELIASIVIPTHNRAEYLSKCLGALSVQEADRRTFEIIVVDNNSSDNTQEVVSAFARSYPLLSVRNIFEIGEGASRARNRGIAEAQGEFICFLDDDSPPEPDWLVNLLDGFVDSNVGCVGGPSELDYQGQEIPPWLHGDLPVHLSAYSLPYLAPTQVSLWQHLPLSCNMAIRRAVFEELGTFRTDLDRSGNQVLAAGDTEMADRVNKAGWKVMYQPSAVVKHIVAPERIHKAHVYRIGYGLAASHVILTADPRPHMIARWFASDLWYATRMLCRLGVAAAQRKPLWFDDYVRFWMVSKRIPIRVRALLHGYNVN